jgi:fumarate reductase subunit D
MKTKFRALIGLVSLFSLPLTSQAVMQWTAFKGHTSFSGDSIEGLFRYDTSEALFGGTHNGWLDYAFSGGSTMFVAKRWDGSIFTTDQFQISLANDVSSSVACGGSSNDVMRFRSNQSSFNFFFTAFDCSSSMFTPTMNLLEEFNIPITVGGSILQYDEEMTGPLGGFRLDSLSPSTSVPEPGPLGALSLGILLLWFGLHRLKHRQ